MGKKQEDNKIPELEQKIANLDKQIVEYDKQLKRAVADYRNLESRISQGRSELTSFVGVELIRKLLPVLDHLEQALAGVKESEESPASLREAGRAKSQSGTALSETSTVSAVEPRSESNGWVKGVELAVKEFKQVLAQEGLDEIVADPGSPPGTGSQFDPALHEAVDTEVGEDNKVLKVVRKGYKLNGKVIRPAQVVVGRKNPPNLEETKNIPGGETQSDFHIPPKEEEKNEVPN